MATRTVKVALWDYRDANGKRRRAYFGDEVDLPKREIDRGTQQGVFDPAPVPEVQTSAVERALADTRARTPEPVLAGADTLPVPPHDVLGQFSLPEPEPTPVLAPINQSAVGGAQPPILDPATVVEQPEIERPKKAESIEKWRAYVVQATAKTSTPISAERAETMTKAELAAAVPAEE